MFLGVISSFVNQRGWNVLVRPEPQSLLYPNNMGELHHSPLPAYHLNHYLLYIYFIKYLKAYVLTYVILKAYVLMYVSFVYTT